MNTMKKMIFCFDGTCNNPSDSGDFRENISISNVLKLHILFGGSLRNNKAENENSQQSFYYSGIGTRGNKVMQILSAALSPAYGEMQDILDEAEEDLTTHYKEGDEIYIFGFSRGAAIARIFAAKHVANRQVKILGVFDTVAAILNQGLNLDSESYPASGVLFEDGSVGAHIQKAVHLLSIDEQRIAFQPTLINKDTHNPNRICEVWFPGVHEDVGGSFWFDGLSDIALQFMLDRVTESGLEFCDADNIDYKNLTNEGDDAICRDDVAINPLVTGKLHAQSRNRLIGKLTLKPRTIRINEDDKVAEDAPILHYSAIERFHKVAGYRPYALRDIRFRIMDKDGKVGDKIYHGIAGIPQAN